mgnify:CR=1 FL=1|tara:strand:- start:11514 stop:12182 length:669 start_codon:yes stop_codon:yes gene_type:complete
MAISTTTILGTDSISASRLTINDNFTVVKDEINSIETYVNPSTATVSGLTLLETSKLTVGPTSSPNLQLTTSAFDINMATTFKKSITQKQYGIFNNFYSTGTTYALKASTNSNAFTMLTSSTFGSYVLIHDTGADFIVTLSAPTANPGQEVTFYLEQSADVNFKMTIKPASAADITWGNNTGGVEDEIELNETGSSVTLRSVTNSAGSQTWYIVGSHNISLF